VRDALSHTGAKLAIYGPLARRPRKVRAAWVRTVVWWSVLIGEWLRRAVDVGVALLLVVVLSPLLLLRAGLAWLRTGRVFERVCLVGRFRTPFQRLRFAGSFPGRSLAVLFNVLRGDMALAGPRPLTVEEATRVPLGSLVRFDVQPGVVSPHVLHERIGVAYESEGETDRNYAYAETIRGNLGLVLRSIPGVLLGAGAALPLPRRLDFFGVTIVNTTMDEAVRWILARARSGERTRVAFVNPDCLNIAYRHDDYRAVLRGATRVLPDGIGIHLGCRLLGVGLAANVNGTDLFPRLCQQLAGSGLKLFLLGGRPGVAAAAASAMQRRYPGLLIAGARPGYFSPAEEEGVVAAVNRSGADILLAGLGVPRQELFLARHEQSLTPAVCMGVGGLFDFYSGRIPRAPLWVREIGLEWLWRLAQEPGRMWRRYLIGNPLFLYRVWKQARGIER
jgi:N-acetylglucosaminyldiphosphoundecaprenol N-acetyl-beta-D-mannosaminyltransferase